MPTGPLSCNVSLVYDYIPHSNTLYEWRSKKSSFTHAQWVYICLKIAISLRRLHEADALHNDLHEGNILIQNPPSSQNPMLSHCATSLPTVFVLDLGSATYKRGKVFTSSYGTLGSYQFLAPELAKNMQVPLRTGKEYPNFTINEIDVSDSFQSGKINTYLNNCKTAYHNKNKENVNNVSRGRAVKGSSKWNGDTPYHINVDPTQFEKKQMTHQNIEDLPTSVDSDQNLPSTKESNDSLTRYPTTSATDIFSLGHIMEAIASSIDLTQLMHLSLWCQAADPENRPGMKSVVAKLERLLAEVRLVELSSRRGCHGYGHNKPIDNSVEHKHFPLSFLFDHRPNLNSPVPFSGRYDRKSYWKATNSNTANYSEDCLVPLLLVDSKDLLEPPDKMFLSRSTDDAVRLAKLNSSQQWVIVKEFYDTEFEAVRHEACTTQFVASLGFAPDIIGLLLVNDHMSEAAFIQERFGQGMTMVKFVASTQEMDWDSIALKRAASGVTQGKVGSLSGQKERKCSLREYFKILAGVDPSFLSCSTKSYRQSALEGILRKVASMLETLHRSGLLINNLHSGNILLGLQGETIRVKLIDLGRVTSPEEGFELGHTHEDKDLFPRYLAPELLQGKVSTMSSDIYSLCIIILESLYSYFPIYHIDAKSVTKDTHKKQYNLEDATVSRRKSCNKHSQEAFRRHLTKQWKCFRSSSKFKCSAKKNRSKMKHPRWKTQRLLETLKPIDARLHKMVKLQEQLLMCVYGEPWSRPTVRQLLDSL